MAARCPTINGWLEPTKTKNHEKHSDGASEPALVLMVGQAKRNRKKSTVKNPYAQTEAAYDSQKQAACEAAVKLEARRQTKADKARQLKLKAKTALEFRRQQKVRMKSILESKMLDQSVEPQRFKTSAVDA